MKNLKNIVSVIVLALVMLSTINVNARTTLNYLNKANIDNCQKNISEYDKNIKISITLTFGRASRGCKGFGICKATISIEVKNQSEFLATNKNDKFTLIITEKGLNRVKEYFGDEMIILEEDFVLPDEITKELELKPGYTLKKGNYRVTHRKGSGIVVF